MIRGKRGDVPIIILVIGVFVVCSLALISFYASFSMSFHSYSNIAKMEELNVKLEKYQNYKKIGRSDEEIKIILGENEEGNLFVFANKFFQDKISFYAEHKP